MTELIILLGEGNYSFAVEFVRMLRTNKLLDSKYEVLASDCLSSSPVIDHPHNHHHQTIGKKQTNSTNATPNNNTTNTTTNGHHTNGVSNSYQNLDPKAQENIRKLIIDYGVRIWTDVDVRNLHHHPRLMSDLRLAVNLKRVHFVFNFPHVKTAKMKIDQNRSLLRDMFMSIEDLSRACSVEVMVYVSLCYGQSGLNYVEPKHRHRSWADSWQLTEMASYGNFVLVNTCSFSSKSFKRMFCDNDQAREQILFNANLQYLLAICQENKENNNQNNNHRLLHSIEDLNLNSLNEEFENYDPFGYRQQSKPFRSSPQKKKFEGGNIFVFEHRDFKFDCFIPRLIYTHPLSSNILVQKFINEIEEIMLENISGCRSVKPYLIEQQFVVGGDSSLSSGNCTQPLDVFILSISLMDSSPQSQYLCMSNVIGRYLKPSYVEDLLTDELCIDDICFGFWSKDDSHASFRPSCSLSSSSSSLPRIMSLNLLVENCLRIKWNMPDSRILYSKYFHIIENPSYTITADANNQRHNKNYHHNNHQFEKIPTTGLLYPQTYHRDISFWWQNDFPATNSTSSSVSTTDTVSGQVSIKQFPQNEFFRMLWDHFQPTNLRSIHLREKYIKSMEPMVVSYCYRLVIQSVDLALDRQKVHDLITTLGIRMTAQFPQIQIR